MFLFTGSFQQSSVSVRTEGFLFSVSKKKKKKKSRQVSEIHQINENLSDIYLDINIEENAALAFQASSFRAVCLLKANTSIKLQKTLK